MKIKSMEKLKAKEISLVARLGKLLAFAKYIQRKVNDYSKNAIFKVRTEVHEQKLLREKHLALLALESERIRGEIVDLNIAHMKHTDNAMMFQ